MGKTVPLSTDSIVKKATSEMQSRFDRRNNIAFYNVKECEGNLKAENMQHDKNFIHTLCSEIGVCIEEEDIRFVKLRGAVTCVILH